MPSSSIRSKMLSEVLRGVAGEREAEADLLPGLPAVAEARIVRSKAPFMPRNSSWTAAMALSRLMPM